MNTENHDLLSLLALKYTKLNENLQFKVIVAALWFVAAVIGQLVIHSTLTLLILSVAVLYSVATIIEICIPRTPSQLPPTQSPIRRKTGNLKPESPKDMPFRQSPKSSPLSRQRLLLLRSSPTPKTPKSSLSSYSNYTPETAQDVIPISPQVPYHFKPSMKPTIPLVAKQTIEDGFLVINEEQALVELKASEIS